MNLTDFASKETVDLSLCLDLGRSTVLDYEYNTFTIRTDRFRRPRVEIA